MRQEFFGVIGEMTTLPGCGQIAVSHGVFTPIAHRNKGLGKQAHQKRLDEAKRLGYNILICTVDAANEVQIGILKEFGWDFRFGFHSKKTGHEVQMWSYHL